VSADRTLLEFRPAAPGENVVVMAGKMNDIAMSNSMKLHRAGG
jgi:hypothetical protein